MLMNSRLLFKDYWSWTLEKQQGATSLKVMTNVLCIFFAVNSELDICPQVSYCHKYIAVGK